MLATMKELKRGEVLLALVNRRATGGLGAAADDLGVTVHHLQSECERLGIDSDRLPALREAKDAAMVAYLERLMTDFQGDVVTAAVVAGMSRQGLSDHLRRYGVDPWEYRR